MSIPPRHVFVDQTGAWPNDEARSRATHDHGIDPVLPRQSRQDKAPLGIAAKRLWPGQTATHVANASAAIGGTPVATVATRTGVSFIAGVLIFSCRARTKSHTPQRRRDRSTPQRRFE